MTYSKLLCNGFLRHALVGQGIQFFNGHLSGVRLRLRIEREIRGGSENVN